MSAASSAQPRSLVVERDGRLRAVLDPTNELTASALFAIVLLWDDNMPGRWIGWLTTIDRRALCFSQTELEDPAFQAWLGALPDWEPGRLSTSLARVGLHLVWRRMG